MDPDPGGKINADTDPQLWFKKDFKRLFSAFESFCLLFLFFILLLLSLFDYIRFRILKLCSIEQLRRTSLL